MLCGRGVGIVLVAIGWLLYGQLDVPAILGMAFIVTGIVVLNVFFKMSPHS